MLRIICPRCKNAYLQGSDEVFSCPQCESEYPLSEENLLSGVQYFNEGNYTEADNCFMKYIVKNGAAPKAIMYKAFIDGRNFDEDTVSLGDTYKKLAESFKDVGDEDLPEFLELANDQCEKLEKELTDVHVRLFADADAEKIKKEVEVILGIQKEALAFRSALRDIVADFNERSKAQISAKFSECFFVDMVLATEVGNQKFEKISANVASHTVFTGILSNDIKNLEIYYRCIVMFFQKSHDKYDFLLAESAKFTQLQALLEEGQYNTIKGTGAIANKLKSISYEFLEESYKEHFDEKIEMQTETIVVTYPEEPEAVEAAEEIAEDVAEIEVIKEEIPEITEEPEAAEEEIPEITEEPEAAEEEIPEITEEPEAVEEEIVEITEEPEVIEEETPEIQEETETATQQYEKVESDIATESEAPAISEKSEEKPASKKKKKSHKGTVLLVLLIVLGLVYAGVTYGPDYLNKYKYNNATELASEKNYVEAAKLFEELGDYSDSKEKLNENKYEYALSLEKEGKYKDAGDIFLSLGDYKDAKIRNQACTYELAKAALDNKEFDTAQGLFESLGDYGDSSQMIVECKYQNALNLIENKEYEQAILLLTAIPDHSDSAEKISEAKYAYVTDNFTAENEKTVEYLDELTIAGYKNSADLRQELLGSGVGQNKNIRAFVNNSATDMETSLTNLVNTSPCYFHVVMNDPAYYGQRLYIKYTTAFGYSQSKSVSFSEGDNASYISYPATQYKNYTVNFQLLDGNGNVLAEQEISF